MTTGNRRKWTGAAAARDPASAVTSAGILAFVSSTLAELADARAAVRRAVESLLEDMP